MNITKILLNSKIIDFELLMENLECIFTNHEIEFIKLNSEYLPIECLRKLFMVDVKYASKSITISSAFASKPFIITIKLCLDTLEWFICDNTFTDTITNSLDVIAKYLYQRMLLDNTLSEMHHISVQELFLSSNKDLDVFTKIYNTFCNIVTTKIFTDIQEARLSTIFSSDGMFRSSNSIDDEHLYNN